MKTLHIVLWSILAMAVLTSFVLTIITFVDHGGDHSSENATIVDLGARTLTLAEWRNEAETVTSDNKDITDPNITNPSPVQLVHYRVNGSTLYQWGCYAPGTTDQKDVISNFLQPFKTADYMLTLTGESDDGRITTIATKSTTGFSAEIVDHNGTPSANKIKWLAVGEVA